jgi:hypothetical protein
MEPRWNDIGRGKQNTLIKACPSATCTTKNSTYVVDANNCELGKGHSRRGKKMETARGKHDSKESV